MISPIIDKIGHLSLETHCAAIGLLIGSECRPQYLVLVIVCEHVHAIVLHQALGAAADALTAGAATA